MLLMRTYVKREPCRRCQILRLYLLLVMVVAIIGFTMNNALSHLVGIQPIFFGYLFTGLAVVTFAVKYSFHRLQKASKQATGNN